MDGVAKDDLAAIRRIPAIPSILNVVCRSTGMGFAAVARVTEDRWVACEVLDNVHFGLPAGGELPVETTLCHEVRHSREEIIIENVAEDPVYAAHHTPRLYKLQSYISVPIILPDGTFFGTLCAIDAKPAKIRNEATIGMFRLFAELIAYHLHSDQELSHSQAEVLDQAETAQLREQFIVVLGHDLRNPLAAIKGGLHIIGGVHKDQQTSQVVGLMHQSVSRMSGLIDNLLDFARGRLGDGISLRREPERRLEQTLVQVIDEIKAGHPQRTIEARFDLPPGIDVDHARIAQMFSNLLGNAVSHGAEDLPVMVDAAVVGGALELSVANGGDPIPPKTMERLFQPFHRREVRPNLEGIGLGLYIAGEIAKAHGGTLDVKSDEEETRFTFRMPITAA
ncbi:GAF domain-containing sensor histidine kinase [Inquilinus sp. CAU 1745]|uniref:GAF domain-containing sensor histidine kinase n=1 Tax=Inquilinus sp. CAU 1745 TaxID=3140369 RepID=UPI00325B42EF